MGDSVDMRVCLVLEVDVANEVKCKQLVNELCIWMSRLTAKGLEKVDGVTVKNLIAVPLAPGGPYYCRSVASPHALPQFRQDVQRRRGSAEGSRTF